MKEFDEATKHELGELLKRLTARGVKELTVLLLGKPGAGKTSTMNSIFNETASAVAAFRAMPTEVEIISRTSNGFTLTFIDTPGLTGHDEVSQASLDAISHALQDKQVDIGERLRVFSVPEALGEQQPAPEVSLAPSMAGLCIDHGALRSDACMDCT